MLTKSPPKTSFILPRVRPKSYRRNATNFVLNIAHGQKGPHKKEEGDNHVAEERKKAKAPGTKPVKKASGGKAAPKSGKKKATFKLHAPDATKVFVAGCFNDWDTAANPLKRDKEGVWTCTLFLEPGEHEYRFVVDNVWWDDPLNLRRRQTEFECENCLILI